MLWRVDSSVPYANICEIRRYSPDPEVMVIEFSPSPGGGTEALWFRFDLVRTHAAAHRRIRLALLHSHNLLGPWNWEQARPVWRADSGEWTRTSAPNMRFEADGQPVIEWELDAPRNVLSVAFCYPYGLTELQSFLVRYPSLDSRSIGVSQSGRSVRRLANTFSQPGSRQAGFYVVARQHAGETPASLVFEGLFSEIEAFGREAPVLWGIPFADIDSVEEGRYGKDQLPIDMNRAWGWPCMRHETLVVKRDVDRWRSRCSPKLILDLHSPGSVEDDGVYAFVGRADDPAEDIDRKTESARKLELALGDYAAEQFVRMSNHPARWTSKTLARWATSDLNITAHALEIPYHKVRDRVLLPADYHEIGRRIARGFLTY